MRPSYSASKFIFLSDNYASLSEDVFPIIAPATMVFVACYLATHINLPVYTILDLAFISGLLAN